MTKTPFLLIASSMALVLSGCSSAKEQLGLNRSSPDEFMVVKRAPLSMPPDYTLAPPRPGAPRPQEQSPYAEAKETVFGGGPAVEAAPPTSVESENLLLQQAGAEYANPDIRSVVDAETAEMVANSKSVTKKLIGLGSDGMEGSVLDPVEESKRLENINGTPADNAPEEAAEETADDAAEDNNAQ